MARSLLEIVQSVGSAIDLGASVGTWTKLGTLVLDGFEKLVSTAGVVPLIGAKLTLNPDRNEPIRPVENSSDQSWQKAKAALAALTLAIYRLPPDLIGTQRDALADEFEAELVRLRKRIVGQSRLGLQQLLASEARLQDRLSRVLELQ